MSIPVNSNLSLQAPILAAQQLQSNVLQDFASPFVRADQLALDHVKFLQPAVATTTSASIKLHDKDGKEIGDVTYDPNDPNSTLKAVNQLATSDWPVDRQEALKLGFEWQQRMEALITLAKLMHDEAMSALRALRG